ncbi:MAG TPA: hypothetical protein VFZ79_12990 [Acidimicrobiales bacterium]
MSAPRAGRAGDIERRAALNGAKLAALITDRWGPGRRERGAIGATATLIEARPGAGPGPDETPVASGAGGRAGWVLADDADRALGPALVWADRHGVDDLHLLVDAAPDPVGSLARQAAQFRAPAPSVWVIEGTSLVAAEPAAVPVRAEAPAPADLVDMLIDAGLEIVVEGGMVRGEVNGLEVARIVRGHTTAGQPIDHPQLEVGVGKADRELTAMVHSGLPTVEQLARVVEIVRRHRRPGAPHHPLNQLVPDRWLRAVLCRAPGLAGLASLRPAEGARPRLNLAERDVAVAVGQAPGGQRVVVGCAVGMVLDLVPATADARLAVDADAGAAQGDPPSRLLLAVPARDDHATIRRLAARLRLPAEVVPIPGDWRAAA